MDRFDPKRLEDIGRGCGPHVYMAAQAGAFEIRKLRRAFNQLLATANLELEAPLGADYCPHGALWGDCPRCPEADK